MFAFYLCCIRPGLVAPVPKKRLLAPTSNASTAASSCQESPTAANTDMQAAADDDHE